MSISIKECIKRLEKNKDVEDMLPEYIKQSMNLNYNYASLKFMFDYYTYCEVVFEDINPYIKTESEKEITDVVNKIVEKAFEEETDSCERRKLADKILEIRDEIIERMKVLSEYVDSFIIYEYVLNRIEYRFKDMEKVPDDDKFVDDILNFLLAKKDVPAMAEVIHSILGQLPMRMARSKYYNIIRNSVALLKGGDISSLEGFEYSFRTVTMLCKNKNMDKYFKEFGIFLNELENLDYENMDEKLYNIYSEKLETNTEKLNNLFDLYLQIGELINFLYVSIVSVDYLDSADDEDTNQKIRMIIRGINALLMGKESDVWDSEEDIKQGEDDDKLEWLAKHFTSIEGRQEKYWGDMYAASTAIDDLKEVQKDNIKRLGFDEQVMMLERMAKLTSNSVFADLEETIKGVTITEEMAEETTTRIIDDLKESFKGRNRFVRRAVMSRSLETMPILFEGLDGIMDYIHFSLEQCDDEAEKYVSKQLIMEIMLE